MAQKTTEERRYLTFTEVANYIGVTTRTVRAMVNDGRLPAYRLGTSIVRFRIEDIDAAFETSR